MTAAGWLPADLGELFGAEATAEESYGVLTVDVPPASWIAALETARDRLGCTFFDWLSAVDEPGTGFRVTAHVAALHPVRRLLLRTTVPHDAPVLPSAVDVYAGAGWHERETHEMFGVGFTDHPGLDHLLLPDNFEGHPLRKDFVLAARVAKAWPGAKEPGESEHGGPRRRQMLPPGVPDPNEWGPLKGQLPPAPSRPARGTARPATGAARTAGDRPPRTVGERPPRRTRSAAEGSASQAAAPEAAVPPRRDRPAAEDSASLPTEAPSETAAPSTRRARGASEGSASQRSGGPAAKGPRRARSASEGSAGQRAVPEEAPPASDEPAPTGTGPDAGPPAAPRSPDAPWHHARPTFTEPAAEPATTPGAAPDTEPGAGPEGDDVPDPGQPRPASGTDGPDSGPDSGTDPDFGTNPDSGPDSGTGTEPRTGTETGTEPRTGTETGTTPDDPSGGPR
ncbi:NADH-quinone oxidoreductase subunit C [Streptomyces sp. NPDC088106]|uniref:NADH-quinone oxidoreductase subunit C n=1 Tax=Streptomyces sp. NPDC088106 TaxID=3154867 RepID=UPI00341986FE